MGSMRAGCGSSFDETLARLRPVQAAKIAEAEFSNRRMALQAAMRQAGIGALWLDASSSLRWAFGHELSLSERIHGAIRPAQGAPIHISPAFEEPKLRMSLAADAVIATWEEDEDPFALIAAKVAASAGPQARLALDPATPFRFAAPLMAAHDGPVEPAQQLIATLRQIKSAAEIGLIRSAMRASWQVQYAVYQGVRPAMSASEIRDFITAAHRALGLRPLFAAVQFGEATAYPHGVSNEQYLRQGDMVLVDLGAVLEGYCSDITRSWVYGDATPRQSMIWNAERDAHAAAFAAAQLGRRCEEIDAAARRSLEAAGFGPGYQLPGLPHRTGHGLGLDIHEEPYIVKGNKTVLQAGMCFSIEPMLCLYGECGVRLEDIVFMEQSGPKFFCPPSLSLAEPFATPASFDVTDAM